MTKIDLMNYGIDYTEGLRRFVGYEDIYRGYLVDFLSEKGFLRLEEDIEACDYRAAFKEAHTLKGLAGNLSLNGLFSELSGLVDSLRTDADGETIRSQYNLVAYKHIETANALSEYLDRK